MSILFSYSKILIIICIIISSNALKVKVNGKQKDYCFTKSIYDEEDTMKIFFLISSGRTEQLNVVFKNEQGKILYQEVTRQRGEYQSDVIPRGDYTLCFSPRTTNEYYISFDMQLSEESAVSKDLAKDKEVKGIKNGVVDLEKLFNDFEKNLKFIVDRRNHHHTILKDIGWIGFIFDICFIPPLPIVLCFVLSTSSFFGCFVFTSFFLIS